MQTLSQHQSDDASLPRPDGTRLLPVWPGQAPQSILPAQGPLRLSLQSLCLLDSWVVYHLGFDLTSKGMLASFSVLREGLGKWGKLSLYYRLSERWNRIPFHSSLFLLCSSSCCLPYSSCCNRRLSLPLALGEGGEQDWLPSGDTWSVSTCPLSDKRAQAPHCMSFSDLPLFGVCILASLLLQMWGGAGASSPKKWMTKPCW